MTPDALADLSGTARADLSPPGLPRHRLSERDFDALAAANADATAIERLREAESSYRRMVLRAVLDLLRRDSAARGPLPPPDAAWDLLVEAERRAPAQIARLIACPQIGAWAAHMVRRLGGDLHDDAPLWVDAGQLHALAASAAIEAGIGASLLVPMRNGAVHLPVLGHALLPARQPWDTAWVRIPDRPASPAVTTFSPERADPPPSTKLAEIVSRNSSVSVRMAAKHGAPTPEHRGSWRARPALTAVCRGETLAVGLEDADPYRLVGRTTAPARLAPADVDRWTAMLHSAWDLVVAEHRKTARELSALIATLAPLPRAAPFRSFSGSTGDAFGGVMLSEPENATQFAATLVHELAHFKLGAVMHLFDLTDFSSSRLGYTPWRDDPRPLRGILHGIYAYFHVTDFWRRQRLSTSGGEAMLAHFEFAFWRDQTLQTARTTRASAGLTDLGRRFLDGVLVTLEPWCSEPVPFLAGDLAEIMARDHLALWRAHHLRPPSALVAELARAWVDGRTAPRTAVGAAGPEILAPCPDARDLDGRACLARLWLLDRERFRQAARTGPESVVAGTTSADCALVSGDRTLARRLYLTELATEPGRISSWVGLGLTDREHGALADRPDLALAVSSAVEATAGRRPEPSELAAWLAPAVISGNDETGRAPDEHHTAARPADWLPGSAEPDGAGA